MSEFAGTLRHRIEIWRHEATRLPNGARSDARRLVGTCLGALAHQGFAAPVAGQSASAMQRLRMTVRANPDIAIDDQLRWKDRRFVVRQLLEDPERPDRLVVHCEELRA